MEAFVAGVAKPCVVSGDWMGSYHAKFLASASRSQIPVLGESESSILKQLTSEGLACYIQIEAQTLSDLLNGYRDLIEKYKVDGVIISVPESTALLSHAKAAINAGIKFIIVDGPLGEVYEIDELYRLSRSAGATIAVGFQRAFLPQVIAVKRRIEAARAEGLQVSRISLHSKELHALLNESLTFMSQSGNDFRLVEDLLGERIVQVSSTSTANSHITCTHPTISTPTSNHGPSSGDPVPELAPCVQCAITVGLTERGTLFEVNSIQRNHHSSLEEIVSSPCGEEEFHGTAYSSAISSNSAHCRVGITVIEIDLSGPLHGSGATMLRCQIPAVGSPHPRPGSEETLLQQYASVYEYQDRAFVHGLKSNTYVAPCGLQEACRIARVNDLASRSMQENGRVFKLYHPSDKAFSVGIAGAGADINQGAIVSPATDENPRGDVVIVAAYARSKASAVNLAHTASQHPVAVFADLDGMISYLSGLPNPLLYVPMIPSPGKLAAILKASAAGIPVLAEKPICCNRTEVEDLISQYKRIVVQNPAVVPGKIFVGQHSAVSSACALAWQIVRENGGMAHLYFRLDWPKIPDLDQRMFDADGGGPVLDLMVYGVSMFHSLCNAEGLFDGDSEPISNDGDATLFNSHSSSNSSSYSSYSDSCNSDGRTNSKRMNDSRRYGRYKVTVEDLTVVPATGGISGGKVESSVTARLHYYPSSSQHGTAHSRISPGVGRPAGLGGTIDNDKGNSCSEMCVSALLESSMVADTVGDSICRIDLRNGKQLVFKSPVHPHACSDPAKQLVLLGPAQPSHVGCLSGAGPSSGPSSGTGGIVDGASGVGDRAGTAKGRASSACPCARSPRTVEKTYALPEKTSSYRQQIDTVMQCCSTDSSSSSAAVGAAATTAAAGSGGGGGMCASSIPPLVDTSGEFHGAGPVVVGDVPYDLSLDAAARHAYVMDLIFEQIRLPKKIE